MKKASRAKKIMTAKAMPALAPPERPEEESEDEEDEVDEAEAASAVGLGEAEDAELPVWAELSLSSLSLLLDEEGLVVVAGFPVPVAVPVMDTAAGTTAVVV